MSRRQKKGFALLGIFLFVLIPTGAIAERPSEGIGQWLQEIGVFGGYLTGDLKNQKDLEAFPLGIRFGFDLKPFTKKFGLKPPGMLELLYEAFAGAITSPKDNAEMGLGFLFRYSYPLTEKFFPYIEAGTGLYYMTLSTEEQSTQFNFASNGGAGFSYFLKENWAVNVGFRMRHVSNASIKEPNGGINANIYLVGVSYYF